MDLQNNFTTGDNRYPKTRQATLHLLDKYTKPAIQQQKEFEGSSFATKGKESKGSNKNKNKVKGNGKKEYDKEYWADRECYRCHKKGHPSYACDEDDDDKSTASSINKLTKELKGMKKQFTTINAKLSSLDEDSEVSRSEDEGNGSSFFFDGGLSVCASGADVRPKDSSNLEAVGCLITRVVNTYEDNSWAFVVVTCLFA